ncbi:MAG: hypothetical protein ACE5II_00240, partial [Anaerolineae bacterium]
QGGILIARTLGATLLGNAVVFWFARNPEDSEARRGIVLGQVISFAIAFILNLLGQLSGVMNTLGWSLVAIFLVLGLGYVYFLLVGSSTS